MKKISKKKLVFLVGVSVIVAMLIFISLYLIFFNKDISVQDKNYCTEKSRSVDVCAEYYEPVCGYMAESCLNPYCKKDFSNFCFACMNEEILFYIERVC